MRCLTIHDQIVRGLVRLGYQRSQPIGLYRYERFVDHLRPESRQFRQGYVYLGRLGAVRVGPTMDDSISSDGLKAKALNAGLPENWSQS